MSEFSSINKDYITSIFDYAVNIRRDIHMHPEPAWLEIRTTLLIADELNKMDLDEILIGDEVCAPEARLSTPSLAEYEDHLKLLKNETCYEHICNRNMYLQTGVIGILKCGDGPVTAIRCDIDALPIRESPDNDHFPVKNGFASIYDGIMHACGHDGHTAVLLGIARYISLNREEFHGTYKFIFQPAEEGARGACAIAARGHMDDVDILLGFHMGTNQGNDPDIVIESNLTLATTKLNASFTGKEAHAANSPETGHNALLAACTAVQNLYSISRHSKSDTRINVGVLHAGETRNIICPHAEMKLEVRGSTSEGNDYMYRRACEILNASALMHNCECNIETAGMAISSPNDPDLAELAAYKINTTGITCKYMPERTWSASEDFSILSDRIHTNGGKTCYMKLISNTPAPLHDCRFDFEEPAIRNGIIGVLSILL